MLRRLVPLLVGVVVLCVVLAAPAFADFGISAFNGSITNQDGSPDTQAGSHPFAVTASLDFNSSPKEQGGNVVEIPDGNVKDIEVKLPAGLVGNPAGVAQCQQQDLIDPNQVAFSDCPASSQIGQLAAHLWPLGLLTVPLYNMVPGPGEPAQFAADIAGVSVYVDIHVRDGSDYGVTASLSNVTSDIALLGSSVTIWGVPADPAHDALRGALCVGSEPTQFCFNGGHSAGGAAVPFMTLASSCVGPQATALSVDSWENPGGFLSASTFLDHDASGVPLGNDGCNRLVFDPSIATQLDTTSADTPAGLTVDVRVPQEGLLVTDGLATADLKNAVVTLPEGLVVNPGQANGLAVCSEAQANIHADGSAPACPGASRVGEDEIETPLLVHSLKGSVYVLQSNPPNLKLLVAASGEGVNVKLVGNVHLDGATGRVTATFSEAPQVPFTDFRLSFNGGPQAALITPRTCGSYTTTTDFTPWSTPFTPDALPSAQVAVDQGVGGGACPAGAPFNPSLTGGTVNNQAGGFSPLSVTFSRADNEQDPSTVSVTTPPGLLALIKNVERCGEPQASQGACGAGSLIGHTTVAVGAGPDPLYVQGGQVFLTGPYKGAPFGLSVVVPAVAGPFDLGSVVVRAAIGVDPHTGQVTVTSDPFPTILDGVPLQLKTINVTIDRPGFMFNPTSCEPLTLTGSLTSTQGATANASSRFQAANCANLGFKPSFSVSTQAGTSKKNGASLDVKVAYPKGAQANIHSVAVTLPKQLPSRLTTIQQACPQATFNQNPAGCPAGSNIGTATALTPVLAGPLTGPAYLVSHGGAAFPDLVLILQGEGVKLELTGSINIKKSITSSAFDAIPDAPISSFELKLPEGPHSALTAVLPPKAKGNLCGTSLVMPTTMTGQNGAVLRQSTKIGVTGCPKVKKAKAKRRAKARKHAKGKKGRG